MSKYHTSSLSDLDLDKLGDAIQVPSPFNDDEQVFHPLIDALVAGEVIQSVECLRQFRDDGLECYVLHVKTDVRDDYLISIWWEDYDGLARWVRAEGNAERSKKLGTDYRNDYE